MNTTNLLKKELKKDYYDINYLEGKVTTPNESVSIVIPTYNRCPFDPTTKMEKYNMLKNALHTLVNQKNVKIKEIVVINDGSTDYTKKVIKQFSKNEDLEIVYLENKKRLGQSTSRNIGIGHTTENLIFICDDDCIYSPFALFGAVYTFSKIKYWDKNIALVKIPVYQRRTHPPFVRRISEIGRLDLDTGEKTDDYDGFPLEYLEEIDEKFLDTENKILKPFEIFDLDQAYLIKKSAVEDVGGFTQLPWEKAIGEHMEFACKLREKGYRMFLTPDPKFQAVHIRFGYKDSEFVGEDWYNENGVTLKDLVKVSNEFSNLNNLRRRPEQNDWYDAIISSRFMILYKRNPAAARKFLNETYKNFVKENKMFSYYPIDDEKEREKVFVSAINYTQKLLYEIGPNF